ncbi:MAG TPA: hypothetical protein VG738_24760 [Chitinophagaceae bacterium]|nr:hypothetical protein [Chitinophagaceae bacterium]
MAKTTLPQVFSANGGSPVTIDAPGFADKIPSVKGIQQYKANTPAIS